MNLALIEGFFTSGSLIIAIGAQNAFVIRQGLLRRHLFLTALLFSTIDAILIISGIKGFGQLILNNSLLVEIAKYFAIIFLFFYGAFALRSAFKANSLKVKDEQTHSSIRNTTLLILALSLLNPHVYLDTVILLGSIALQHPVHEQMYFASGAICASFIWFFTLTYGSRFLAPFLCTPKAWKVINSLTAIMMWAIAITLLNL